MDHPKPWLRYVAASKVNDRTLELDTMTVRNDAGDEIGSVDGLVVDSESGRPYYVAVDAGGLMKSRRFLVPIGRLRLAAGRDALLVALTTEQIGRFPGFDTREFDRLSESDIKRINDQIGEVCDPGVRFPADEPYTAAWTRPSYSTPDWWPARTAADTPGTGPHFDGRAQPGDVLGVETEGARTSVGDTKEDERERQRAALKEVDHVDR